MCERRWQRAWRLAGRRLPLAERMPHSAAAAARAPSPMRVMTAGAGVPAPLTSPVVISMWYNTVWSCSLERAPIELCGLQPRGQARVPPSRRGWQAVASIRAGSACLPLVDASVADSALRHVAAARRTTALDIFGP